MLSIILTTAVLPLLALTAPTPSAPSLKRAGGPIAEPIPSNCTISDPWPNDVANPGYGFKPTESIITANQVYSFYIPQDDITQSEDDFVGQCLEQCYGFGNKGDCVSVFVAEAIPYTAYGVNNTGVGCLMFGKSLSDEDFVAPAQNGTYTYPKAVNINCP